jgi:hypothetical protein
MINLPHQPSPDSELGRALARLESLREEANTEQQRLVQIREQLTSASTAIRRARYAPRHMQPTPLEFDELAAAVDEIQSRFDQQEKLTKPILAALNTHEEATARLYADYQRASRAAAELARLGG